LIIATEEDDHEAELIDLMDMEDSQPIDFEYHGRLYYSWPARVVVAKDLRDWKAKPQGEQWPPEGQVARMLLCIQIAHVFFGTLEAFRRLFLSEIAEQVGGYVRKYSGGREPQELNRLRTLALIRERLDRVLILSELVLALALLLAIAVYVTWPDRRRRRGVR
jgi:hypothetical protein